jgi:hypothetical protein
LSYWLRITPEAKEFLKDLKKSPARQGLWDQTKKALHNLETNPRHSGLRTHKFDSMKGPRGEQMFTAYIQNNTPSAHRIFFYYGNDSRVKDGKPLSEMVIFAITPHP